MIFEEHEVGIRKTDLTKLTDDGLIRFRKKLQNMSTRSIGSTAVKGQVLSKIYEEELRRKKKK